MKLTEYISILDSFIEYSLIVFYFLDAILLYYAKKHHHSIDNKYFKFHEKYGYFQIEFLKLIAVLMIIGSHYYATGKSGFFLAAAILFYTYVLGLLKDILSATKIEKRNLDSCQKNSGDTTP